MKKALYIALLMIQELRRDRAAWASMLLIPLLITFIMGLAFGGTAESKIPVSVVDKDRSYYSGRFVDLLKKEKTLKVNVVTESKARNSVRKSEVEAAVLIPSDFGKNLEEGKKSNIQFVKLAGSSRAMGISEIVTGISTRLSSDGTSAFLALDLLGRVQTYRSMEATTPTAGYESKTWREIYKKADKNWEPQPPVKVEFTGLKASKVRGEKTIATGMSQTSIGFTVLFVTFMLLEQAGGILDERQKGTLSRLLTTPTSKTSFLVGKLIGLFMVGSIQSAILILAGKYVFDVNWGTSIPGLMTLMGSYILAATGLGILVSALVRTLAQSKVVVPLLVMSSSMLAGCFWPIEIVPPYMQTIAKAVPAGWAVSGLVDLIVRYKGMEAVYLPSLVLIGFAVVFLAAGVKLLRFE